ncbi:2-octaprenyl-6-methoxyphenyl hydroxylase [Vibrio makurazakiensis]|uniref:2-octaprenyl-6-methoxyphenyl hydroxylase n=1 Tax=Vibrio makurazakiensis TaxID=2910250 RepID=UPI003D1068DB
MAQFDVVIAGGAMAGATLALALNQISQRSLSIAVVEPFQVDQQAHPGFDSRSIALSYGTVQILDSFQLWQSIASVATPIQDIHVSDRGHAGMTDIYSKDFAVDALGYVVELADVGRIYQQKLESETSIALFCPDSVKKVERTETHTNIELTSGQNISTKLLVAADGAISTCCEQLGIPLAEHDFEQVAVIANIVASEPHNGRAFERFTHHGPVALLPMSDNRLSLVWCLPPEEASRVVALDEQSFLTQLQSDFGWRLGELKKVGQRASYPLILRYREQNISHRFAIVGNAAQTLHPIAGQGFNLGIRDVASLAESLCEQLDDVGRYSGLVNFRKRREQDRTTTIALTSSLVHLFSNDWLATRIGRNVGLAAIDNLPPLKGPLLRHTLGLVDR